MGLFRRSRDRPARRTGGGGTAPEELARRARAGDDAARERLLDDYQPFVVRVASRASGRYLRAGLDDEVSIGLLALNEAIDRFDPVHGRSFLGFAETVIRRRLVDHYRRFRRHNREIPLSHLDGRAEDDSGAGMAGGTVLDRYARDDVQCHVEVMERREEIVQYRRLLSEFGLEMGDLPAATPRHRDARARAVAVARLLAAEKRYTHYLWRYKSLPLKELEADPRVAVSRKTLERQRRYLIALTLLLAGDFDHLRAYLPRATDSREGSQPEGGLE